MPQQNPRCWIFYPECDQLHIFSWILFACTHSRPGTLAPVSDSDLAGYKNWSISSIHARGCILLVMSLMEAWADRAPFLRSKHLALRHFTIPNKSPFPASGFRRLHGHCVSAAMSSRSLPSALRLDNDRGWILISSRFPYFYYLCFLKVSSGKHEDFVYLNSGFNLLLLVDLANDVPHRRLPSRAKLSHHTEVCLSPEHSRVGSLPI